MATIKVTPDIRRGRVLLACTVILGHAIKHIYNSGLQTILLPEIKIGMGLSATQLGTLAFSRQMTGWVTTVGAGYLGDRFANRASLMLAISMILMGVSYFLAGHASHLCVHGCRDAPDWDRPLDVPSARHGCAVPQIPRQARIHDLSARDRRQRRRGARSAGRCWRARLPRVARGSSDQPRSPHYWPHCCSGP